MTRHFLDDIRTRINNSVGAGLDLSGNIDKQIRLDTIDSTINDECAIVGQTLGTINLTNTFQVIATLYESQVGGDGVFLIPDFASGTITGTATAGFSYAVSGSVGFIADNGEDYEFTIMRNGVAVGFIDSQTGTGNGDLQTANVEALDLSAPASAVWGIGARLITGSADLDIDQIGLTLTIKPTNNAT